MMAIDPSSLLRELYDADQGNRFDNPSIGALFDPPLVGIVAADDPRFARFKEIIGDFHWPPRKRSSRPRPGRAPAA
jgi:hypothetical protein